MKAVHLLMWKYSDKSAFGVLRAYADRDEAEADCNMIEKVTTNDLWVETVELKEGEQQ